MGNTGVKEQNTEGSRGGNNCQEGLHECRARTEAYKLIKPKAECYKSKNTVSLLFSFQQTPSYTEAVHNVHT